MLGWKIEYFNSSETISTHHPFTKACHKKACPKDMLDLTNDSHWFIGPFGYQEMWQALFLNISDVYSNLLIHWYLQDKRNKMLLQHVCKQTQITYCSLSAVPLAKGACRCNEKSFLRLICSLPSSQLKKKTTTKNRWGPFKKKKSFQTPVVKSGL